ncbi:MAG: PIG-L family deacetylase [Christensenellaceae bacterium]|jgi:LmbE family N-acetylglucosaminyl deacetylase|nr:PIG-L family deacetylase [Christensenellaceae bacterium]
MKFVNAEADIHIPDHADYETALQRTTYLSIAAHQDDCEIMAYHAIAKCYESDTDWYTAVILSDGGGSPRSGAYADYTNQQIHEKRSAEQRDAADVGKYSAVVQLAYSSKDIRSDRKETIEAELTRILLTARPRVLFIHNPIDRHETHFGAFMRAINALRQLPPEAQPEKVYGMEVWRSLDWLSAKDRLVFDTSAYPGVASGVIQAFESQCTPLKRFDLAALGRRLGNATFQAPRDNDPTDSCNLGVDLTPLIQDVNLDIRAFALGLIANFRQEVETMFQQFYEG